MQERYDELKDWIVDEILRVLTTFPEDYTAKYEQASGGEWQS